MTSYSRPQVGVGVIMFGESLLESTAPNQTVLLGLRKGDLGKGKWGLPGGKLEYGEGFGDCCRREVLEETGLEINGVLPLGFTNDFFPEQGEHFVTLFFLAETVGGTLENREPDKHETWEWVQLEDLANRPLFAPFVQFFKQLGFFRDLGAECGHENFHKTVIETIAKGGEEHGS